MIEILDGLHESINFGDSLGVKLFHNAEYEDYPEHWHTGLEIIMPIHSGYTVIIGNDTYTLEEGDIIIINSGVLHSLKAPLNGERAIFQFKASLLYSVKGMETLLSILPQVMYFSREKEECDLYCYIKHRMDEIIDEYNKENTFCEAIIYVKLIEIFVKIGRSLMEHVHEKNHFNNKNNFLKKKEYMEAIINSCNYINEHYHEKISLEEISKISGFSKFHFTRIFKQCMDVTFYEYLNQKRIERAEELLYTTNNSITDIALSSGFTSISAFNRAFKTMKKCSPSEYRNKK